MRLVTDMPVHGDPLQRIAVWGTGNMGSTAIRSVVAFPGLELSSVITSMQDKAGRDAASFATLDGPTGVAAIPTSTPRSRSVTRWRAWREGEIRPEEAIADIERCLRAGKHAVTPWLYSLYDPASTPTAWVDRLSAAAEARGGSVLGLLRNLRRLRIG